MATSNTAVDTAEQENAQDPPESTSGDNKISLDTANAKGAGSSSRNTAGEEDLITKVLRYMSTATAEVLVGITIGLAAFTYLVLGRIGLVLIGAFGGIILHATWEGQIAEDMRREKGLDVAKRVLDWREDQRLRSHQEQEEEPTVAGRGFEDFRPETAIALSSLVEAVVQDYIKWWYRPILPTDESFPAACRHTLTTFLRSISIHLSRKRPADAFLDFLTNSSSIVIVFLSELSTAIASCQGTGVSPSEAVQEYLICNPESNLANVLNDKQQKKKFKAIAEDILQNFLDKPVLSCNQSRIFLREILSGVVMDMTLNACSRPEWINGCIVYLLEDGEPELIQAIDAGMGSATSEDVDVNKLQRTEEKKHRKRLSKAEEAMEEAMQEARRLSRLIAEEDVQKQRSLEFSRRDTVTVRSLQSINKTINPAEQPKAKANSTIETERSAAPDPSSMPQGVQTPDPIMPQPASGTSFTSFDQMVPQTQPTALQSESQRHRRQTASLTLHNATITIHDDSTPNDKGRIRNKPVADYMVQIEPESSQYPGWMIVRHYSDFETLHEVLRRIAAISGVAAFTEQHSTLPSWKAHTKASLRGELERYLRDACWHQQLAESEGMKRFLEKDQAQLQAASNKGLSWPSPSAFETVGKGMLDVLAIAPKGASDGGKAVLGGVTGVLGNIGSLGQKKRDSVSSLGTHIPGKVSTSTLVRLESSNPVSGTRIGMESDEKLNATPIVHTQPSKIPSMERKLSFASFSENGFDNEMGKSRVSLSSRSGRGSTSNSRNPSRAPSLGSRISSPTATMDADKMALPPPPSDIPDDYGQADESSTGHSRTDSLAATARTSTSSATSLQSPTLVSLSGPTRPLKSLPQPSPTKSRKIPLPLSEPETRVAVELLFAVINELYTLSSAWNIRRTLLTAAKTFLLRPGNPSLASIQSLIQDSIIASNTSDSGIATQVRKLRENVLPTEEELKAWPPEMSTGEKQKLKLKARKLFLERGVPTALTGVMGQVATNDAMGKVFDCLQIEEVARGLMFGLLLQGVRAVTH